MGNTSKIFIIIFSHQKIQELGKMKKAFSSLACVIHAHTFRALHPKLLLHSLFSPGS